MRIRPVTPDDSASWHRLRCELWPGDDADHEREIRSFFDGRSPEPAAVLVAEEGDELVGFVELSIRPYAEGCRSQNVGYVEGWYVAESMRRRGVGRALIAAAEDWARGRGCTEMGSDAELTNALSKSAHEACGFEETGQIRSFRKPL